MANHSTKPATGISVKRHLAQLAQDHVRMAFNSGFAYAAAVQPKGKTVDYCRWFVAAFRKELDRHPIKDKKPT